MVNVLLVLRVSILLLVQPAALLVRIPDVLFVLVLDKINVPSVKQIITEVILVLLVILANSP